MNYTQLTGYAPASDVAAFVDPLIYRIAKSRDVRDAVRHWLTDVGGLPEKVVNRMRSDTLAKAYLRPRYLAAIKKGEGDSSYGPAAATISDDDLLGADTALDAGTKPVPQVIDQTAIAREIIAGLQARIDNLITAKLERTTLRLDDKAKEQIRALARSEAETTTKALLPPREIAIKPASAEASFNLGLQHEKFEILLRACAAKVNGQRLNILLTGPTGSGKTTAAMNVAKALGLAFEAEGSLDADFKLLGYMDANGRYVETAFFRRYTQGGIILLDEIDGYSPSALLALNAASANNFCQFPHGKFDRHSDCIIIAAANTWGLGATNEYVGRNKLDAATLDRFQPKIHWPIDTKLERAIAERGHGTLGCLWHNIISAARTNAQSQGLKVIISPRATFSGLALLSQGFTMQEVVNMTFGAGLSETQLSSLKLIYPAQSEIDFCFASQAETDNEPKADTYSDSELLEALEA